LAFLALTTLATAQNNRVTSRPQNDTGKGIAYVDANKNAVCDNYETRASNDFSCRRCRNISCCGQGQGQRPGKGQKGWGQVHGRNFVDADSNGKCDFNETPAKK
jgi:hypothetical protein